MKSGGNEAMDLTVRNVVDSLSGSDQFISPTVLTFIPLAGRMAAVVENCTGALSTESISESISRHPHGARKTMTKTGYRAEPPVAAGTLSPIMITTVDELITTIFGGKSTVTIQSSSGTRFTYRFKTPKNKQGGDVAFASLLRGSDNTSDYRFAFSVFKVPGGFVVKCSAKGCVTKDAGSFKAMEFLASIIRRHKRLPGNVTIWRMSTCRRCGRDLTSEWAPRGIGPVCVGKEGGAGSGPKTAAKKATKTDAKKATRPAWMDQERLLFS